MHFGSCLLFCISASRIQSKRTPNATPSNVEWLTIIVWVTATLDFTYIHFLENLRTTEDSKSCDIQGGAKQSQMEAKLQVPRPERSPSIASSHAPPPSYISRVDDTSDSDFESEAQDPDTLGLDVRNDGRVDVNCHAPLGRRLSRLLGNERTNSLRVSSSTRQAHKLDEVPPPKLNIVVQVAGSRGDVQPFIALGCALQRDYGHRVRLATHATFEDFVRSSGLEFYPLGGDPAELMAYIVKNPGIIPSFASIKAGDIGRKREMLGEMLEGCWKSCIERDQSRGAPFVAEAIIANPQSMGPVHCAQAAQDPSLIF